MSRRTLRKPTRWTPEEWAQVERAAADRGVPPLRYVREAALGTPPKPQPGRGQPLTPARRARSLWHQLARVINNLHQLRRVAEVDGDDDGVRVLTVAAGSVEYVISAAPAMLGARDDEVIRGVVEAGNALNALAHRANTAEELPSMGELRAILTQVETAVRRCREWAYRIAQTPMPRFRGQRIPTTIPHAKRPRRAIPAGLSSEMQVLRSCAVANGRPRYESATTICMFASSTTMPVPSPL